MPKRENLTTTGIIAIIVVAAITGSVLILTVVRLLVRRRHSRSKKNVTFSKPRLRGGCNTDNDHETVVFMKSGSHDMTPHGSPELDNTSYAKELDCPREMWNNDIPRALQPGQTNTALPEYRPLVTHTSKFELEDTSRRELPPTKSDERLRPTPLNFSRPAREHVRCASDKQVDTIQEDGSPSSVTNPDPKQMDTDRVESPTVVTPLQHTRDGDALLEERPSPVSPLVGRASVSSN